MGYGTYSSEAYASLVVRHGYQRKSRSEIFDARRIDPDMDPRQVTVRESRDSVEHPNSVPIVVALDVTGSMGFVPEQLVRNDLPKLMDGIIQAGIADPQIMFCAVGDHIHDRAPLQVGQFESSAELLDRWLTRMYLEGGGGGNHHESYNLAYLFAARHTASDAWDKRRQKGFLFTIGDEPCAPNLPDVTIRAYTSGAGDRSVSTEAVLAEAGERYHVHHLHVVHDAVSATARRTAGWAELLGPDFVVLQDPGTVGDTIASIVVDRIRNNRAGRVPDTDDWVIL
ncbi:MAG: hypothetical protein OES24_11625 [Acidimicrobiia bacterium]|nr:hypothetical protein [Acidimicrobiia bacterium]